MRLKSIGLDRLAAIAMIVASGVLVWVGLSMQLKAARVQPPMYAAGDHFDPLPGADFAGASRTLVMFVRSGCKYCTASAPFYKRLLERTGRVPVIAVSFDSEDRLRAYLDEQDVQPDRMISARRGSLRLGATPVLLLVSSTGKIERVWLGQLRSTSQEAEVFSATTR